MESELAGMRPERLVVDADDRAPRYPRGDRLKQLRSFCHAARVGSIARAAKQLGWSQPSMSQQVSALEEELGLSLFERRGPYMVLSRDGERVYRLAMPLVHGMDRFPDTFAERHYGVARDVLCIGAGSVSAMYLLPEYLERFREECPGVRIDLKIGTGRERLRWLRNYELDLAITAMDVPPPDLEFHPLLESHAALITPLDHPLAGRDAPTMEEATIYPFVAPSPNHYIRQVVETILREQGITVDVVVEVDGWDVITNYVAAGVGISLVPDLCVIGDERLWKTSVRSVIPKRMYGAVTRRDESLALAESCFLRLVVEDGSQTP